MSQDLRTDGTIKEIIGFNPRTKLERPLLGVPLPAGFPSPAQDYVESTLDLNEHLIHHPAATFFVRVDGDSMIGAGIFPDDILIVDRSLQGVHSRIIIAVVDGALTVKRLNTSATPWRLEAENPNYPPIILEEGIDFLVWGVVTYVIHKV
jgi:DNA polymerase V